LRHLGVFPVGPQPKSAVFDSSGRYVHVALLGTCAVASLDLYTLRISSFLPLETDTGSAGSVANTDGLVELLLDPVNRVLIATRMHAGEVLLFPANRETVAGKTAATGGLWPKVAALSPDRSILAVSNWLSEDVSLLSYPELTVVARVSVPGTPRGLVFSRCGRYLYVADFAGGNLYGLDVRDGTRAFTVGNGTAGALRHLVLSADGTRLYASDMLNGTVNVYAINPDGTPELMRRVRVGINPNTIALTPDQNLLLVSCRGPNHPESYLYRSPEHGSLVLVDTTTLRVLEERGLGNQPTALSVNQSGRLIVVSNFQDGTIELFELLK
jgi:DNA-binding beta-propeller fold protein YncE